MKKLKRWIAAIAAVAAFITITYGLGDILMPTRKDYGSIWDGYLQEKKNTIDVLVCGTSLAYCDLIPAVIWENSGITSYVMAGAEQTIPISYYYIKEACKTQHPKAVFLEASGMFYNRYQEFTKVNIGYMPWSVNRLHATFEAAERSEIKGLLFPLYNYHYRSFEISGDEVYDNTHPQPNILAGYTLLTEQAPAPKTIFRRYNADKNNILRNAGKDNTEENYQHNLSYIQKLATFCNESGIDLYMYLAPSRGVLRPYQMSRMKNDFTGIAGVNFVDFNDSVGKMNIDDNTDWHDWLHFNINGARKFSAFFSNYLRYVLSIDPTDKADTLLWEKRAQYIDSQ